MKELEPIKRPETVIRADQKKEYTKIGSIIIKPGLTLFMLNTDTMEIEPVKTTGEVILDTEKNELVESKKRKTNYNHRYLYVQALNKKNAERKFLKMINGFNI